MYRHSCHLVTKRTTIAFFSHLLTPCENAWSGVELEANGVGAACDKLSHFQLGGEFEIVVDKQRVSFLFTGKPEYAIKNAKLACWRLQILEYPFTFVYRPGRLQSVADAYTHCSAISAPITNFKAIKKLHESMGHPGTIQLCAYMVPFHEVSRCDVLELTGPMR